jgi:ribosome-associated toxin RatA of RatAB toxin-antitoxin module
MVRVEVNCNIPERSADEVWPIVIDMERYPGCVDTVKSIVIGKEADGTLTSTWEVSFHGGIMRWKEADHFNEEDNSIVFKQIEGDVDYFAGEWRLTDVEGGCKANFWADFELGVPALNIILEPIAKSALQANVKGILLGLLGPSITFE